MSDPKQTPQPHEGGITDPEIIAWLERNYPPPSKESGHTSAVKRENRL